ncbi:ATP-dependent zinc metalloprotease FtsH [Spirochaeta cellobiosiphila]|uniref:ATP-dependent zinc metalloprotease FtsH n=1 Tax=Spirochaeta cellobiosiphila TaxID=504483 RepID=UPI0004266A0A|nr:ATP-dependent zinc metalloprotease FtsH [Spirochaeta cellobiosiphila]
MSENNEDKNKDKGPISFNFKNNRFAFVLLMIISLSFLALFLFGNPSPVRELEYSAFLEYLDQGKVKEVRIVNDSIVYELSGSIISESGTAVDFKTILPYPDSTLLQKLEDHDVRVSGKRPNVSFFSILIQSFPWIFAVVIIFFMYRQVQGGGNKAFSFGKSKAKKYTETTKKITFADVAGQNEAKEELSEVVEFLKNPLRFTNIGAKIPKGVLLVGMPGTGKTLLARAIAGEAGVNYFHMSGSDFVEMFVGVGASRVRDLFEQGRKNSPCIIFIDELDAVGRTRGAGYGGGHDEREQTLNQMLVEMDGFESKDGVIIIAATNRPDVLDPALLRPGRFDRQVVVDMPDVKERQAILTIHSNKIKMGTDIDLERIARATPGSSGADIANLVNEAALFAARKGKVAVEMDDFEEARDKLLMGVARTSRVINPKDKLATSYHEAGHALLHYYLEFADPLHKVTVVPRGRALGVAMSLPEEDKYSRDSGWLLDRIKIAYGGYAAEKIVYGRTSTGVQNDLEQATGMARRMVCEWGMSENLGPVAYGQKEEPIFIGKEIAQHKDYSDVTADKIDGEIKSILSNCLNEVMTLLTENRDKLDKLADALVHRETLDDKEVRELLQIEPFSESRVDKEVSSNKEES